MASQEREIGDGIYVRDTGEDQQVNVSKPDSRNRTWLMPNGSTQRSGGKFENGQQLPFEETDLDRIRREFFGS